MPPPGKWKASISQRPYKEFSSNSTGNATKADHIKHDIWDIVATVTRGGMLRFLKYFHVDKSIPIPISLFSKRMLNEQSFDLLLFCDSLTPGFIDNLSAELIYNSLLDLTPDSPRSQFTFIRDILKRRPDIIKKHSPDFMKICENLFSVILSSGNRWIHKQKDLDEVIEVFQELYRLGETPSYADLILAGWEECIDSLHSKRIDCSNFVAFFMEIPQVISRMNSENYQTAITCASLDKISALVQRVLVSSYEKSKEVPLSAVINDNYPPDLMAKLASDPTLRKLRYKLNCKHDDDIATFLRCCGETASIRDFMAIFSFFEELGLASEFTNRVTDIVNRCSLGILKALSERGFPFFGSMLNFSSLVAVIASDGASKGFRGSLVKEKVDILSQLNPDWPPPDQVDIGKFLTEVGEWMYISPVDTFLYLDFFLERGAIVNTGAFTVAMDHRYAKTLWEWFETHPHPINESTLQRPLAIAMDDSDPAYDPHPFSVKFVTAE